MKYNKLIVYTDGGARGNPGPAAIGVVVYDTNKKIIKELSEKIGKATNNVAEYTAVIKALEVITKLGVQEVDFYLDSELVVKQLKREYKVKNRELGVLFVKIYNQLQKLGKIKFYHVPRAQNVVADALVNKALDS